VRNNLRLPTLINCNISRMYEHGDWHGAIADLLAANNLASNVEMFGQGYGPRKLLHR
jgi:hypothetical protein